MFLSQAKIERKSAIIDMVRRHGYECGCDRCVVFFAAPVGESTNAVIAHEEAIGIGEVRA